MEGRDLGVESHKSDPGQPEGEGSGGGDGGAKGELGRGGCGEVVKKKRGRPPRVQPKQPPAKKCKEEEDGDEDVCFICFDGGNLVLCDRRGCPKAYHPACIKRDEAFFQSKARWFCGWHICSICQKTAHHMCYTCTYSLCKVCVRKADYVSVRDDKGFCTICMKTIMLIENSGQEKDGTAKVDFDDKTSWEYLFKVYWVYLKGKLSLTMDELTQATNPWKVANTIAPVHSSAGVHTRVNDVKSITSASSSGNLEENESKKRKTVEQSSTILHNGALNTEKVVYDESSTKVPCKEWATKELLDFVSHMKNGDTSVLSLFDAQALMLEYIKRNNLRDPKKKSQIVCDPRLKNLFGKPRVGDLEMLNLLGFHFLTKEGSQKSTINGIEKQGEVASNGDNMPMVGKDKRSICSMVEERTPQNKLDQYAAVNVHNMNLIYLRRTLMENLLEDIENFHGKVVGSIVRIRVSGNDQKHDMYRLVQVVGTSKTDIPYKIGNKSLDVMLEVLNLDKKETVSIDTISNEEFFEDECRRLRQSIRCGLVKRFTVGEIQEKAVALQSVKLNHWMEAEILRLNHLCDVTSEKGHKKGHRECMEKLQLLKTPEERERRLREVPEVHSDPKMNPDYESDDTEEYFNTEPDEHMKPKYSAVSSKNAISPPKRADSVNDAAGTKPSENEHLPITTHPCVEEELTKPTVHQKDAPGLTTEGKPQFDVDSNRSTITKSDHQTALASTVSNNVSETLVSSSDHVGADRIWHYRDPKGKVQGPFSMVELQKWSTTGYFPDNMRIWVNREDDSSLLADVLSGWKENVTAADKVGNRIEGQSQSQTVCSAIPSSTIPVAAPCGQNSISEKLSDSHGSSCQSFGQNWLASNNLNVNPTLTKSNESTGQFNTPDPPPTTEVKDVPTVFKDTNAGLVDFLGPTPKTANHEDEKVQCAAEKVQPMPPLKFFIHETGNPPSWSSASSLVVGAAKLPETASEWGGCSAAPVKHEEWDSGLLSVSLKPPEVMGDHVATPTSNIEQNIHSPCNGIPSWHGVGEMIEFSTLAEESVSDLLAEVDAMESQNGFPSPTSRRNSMVEELFNGSFEEFSPTPDQGTRSDGFSSSGDIQLPCHSTAGDEHFVGASRGNNINAFDLMKSGGLQQHSFMNPPETTVFRWPETERRVPPPPRQTMIDINTSAKAEADDVRVDEMMQDGRYTQPAAFSPLEMCLGRSVPETAVGGGTQPPESGRKMKANGPPEEGEYIHPTAATPPKPAGLEFVSEFATAYRRAGTKLADDNQEDGEFIQPEVSLPPPPPRLPPPLTMGLDSGRPAHGISNPTRLSPHTNMGRSDRRHGVGGERHSGSPRERSHHKEEENGYSRSGRTSWGRQSSFGGGSHSRPPSKGQRVCKFYESGRCKKGATCKYMHP